MGFLNSTLATGPTTVGHTRPSRTTITAEPGPNRTAVTSGGRAHRTDVTGPGPNCRASASAVRPGRTALTTNARPRTISGRWSRRTAVTTSSRPSRAAITSVTQPGHRTAVPPEDAAFRSTEIRCAGPTSGRRVANPLATADEYAVGGAAGEHARIPGPSVGDAAYSPCADGTDHAGACADRSAFESIGDSSAGHFSCRLAEQSTGGPADRSCRRGGVGGGADAVPVDVLTVACADLVSLNGEVLARTEHGAEDNMFGGELGERGQTGLGGEARDRADRPLPQ